MKKVLPYHFSKINFVFTGYGKDCRNFDIIADGRLIGHAHQGCTWRWPMNQIMVECFNAFDRAALQAFTLWGSPSPEEEYAVYPRAEDETFFSLNYSWFKENILAP